MTIISQLKKIKRGVNNINLRLRTKFSKFRKTYNFFFLFCLHSFLNIFTVYINEHHAYDIYKERGSFKFSFIYKIFKLLRQLSLNTICTCTYTI